MQTANATTLKVGMCLLILQAACKILAQASLMIGQIDCKQILACFSGSDVQAFTKEAVASYMPTVMEAIRLHQDQWEANGHVFAFEEGKSIALDVAMTVLIGLRLDVRPLLRQVPRSVHIRRTCPAVESIFLPLTIAAWGLFKCIKPYSAGWHRCICNVMEMDNGRCPSIQNFHTYAGSMDSCMT